MEIKNKYFVPVLFLLLISFIIYRCTKLKTNEKKVKGKITRLVPWSSAIQYEFNYKGEKYEGVYIGILEKFKNCHVLGNCNGDEIWIVFDSLNPSNNNLCIECYDN